MVLSNFTPSSRSSSWKRVMWPPSPANYSLFLSPSSSSDHRSTALRPALAQNYEGYFQHCNLKDTWYTHRHKVKYRTTHSANTQPLGIDQKTREWRGDRDAHKDTWPIRIRSVCPECRVWGVLYWVAQYRKTGWRPSNKEMWKKLICKQEASIGMLWQGG